MNVPSLKLHKGTGQSYVYWQGAVKYFGKHGLPTTDRAYWRWRDSLGSDVTGGRSVGEIVKLFSESRQLDRACRSRVNVIRDCLGSIAILEANSYTPQIFLEHREAILKSGDRTARYINDLMKYMRHIIKWGAGRGYVDAIVWSNLGIVAALKEDEAKKQSQKRQPACLEDVLATMEHLEDNAWAMVRLQLLTGGARPMEIVSLRKSEINRDMLPGLWFSELKAHKTAKKKKKRWLVFKEEAQQLLTHFIGLSDPNTDWVFPSKVIKGSHYAVASLQQAVGHACKTAGVPKWTPYQLRHLAGTQIAIDKGLQAAADALGHASPSTTNIYQHAPSADDIKRAS